MSAVEIFGLPTRVIHHEGEFRHRRRKIGAMVAVDDEVGPLNRRREHLRKFLRRDQSRIDAVAPESRVNLRHLGLEPAGGGTAGDDEGARQPGLRRARCIEVKVMTSSPSWFLIQNLTRMMPRSGLERDGVFSTISNSVWSVVPGRTGRSQRSSSKPGEPMLQARNTPVSSTMRKPSARV